VKFGVERSSPAQVVDLDTRGEHLRVILADGTDIESQAVLIAIGASYCTLPLPRWNDFERAGIYYAATKLEGRNARRLQNRSAVDPDGSSSDASTGA